MLRPVAVQRGLALTQLSAGDVHTCGNTAAAAHCWGWNLYGQGWRRHDDGPPGADACRRAAVACGLAGRQPGEPHARISTRIRRSGPWVPCRDSGRSRASRRGPPVPHPVVSSVPLTALRSASGCTDHQEWPLLQEAFA